MGRAPLILLFLLFLAKAAAFDFSHSCSEEFEDYYFGGEHVYFYCRIEPDSRSDAEEMDGLTYELTSQLDSAALAVEVKLRNGKVLLHPLPDDKYESENRTTKLEFYVPESDGIDEIVVRVQGYIPVIAERLKNLTVLSVFAGEKLFDVEVTVVNRQKFYGDMIEFGKSSCADRRKLEEARSYYDEEKYFEAERLMAEVERAIRKCEMESMKEAYSEKLESLEDELSELKRDVLILNFTVKRDAESIENYAEVVAGISSLSAKIDELERELDEISKMIDDAKFEEANLKLNDAREKLENLKPELQALKDSIKKKGGIDLFLIVAAGAAVAVVVVAVAALLITRRREKW